MDSKSTVPWTRGFKSLSPRHRFEEKHSRFTNCLAAFLSHYWLWKTTAAGTHPHIIFEHDAVVVNTIPNHIEGDIVNLGKPSYGKFKTPSFLGTGPLTSKRYFPGAHAYRLTPKGAQQLIDECTFTAGPTDIYIHSSKFTLGEYYPWPVEARDSFTTIQQKAGCYAKHNYGESYEII